MKKFIEEFKEFAVKGNVLDMAVGVVIGSAFGKIVSSFVADIITPLVGIILGRVDLSNLSLTVGGACIAYGKFIQSIIDFLLIAASIFIAIKAINKLKRKGKQEEEKEEEKEKEPSEEVKLLTEIRDALKK